MLMGAGAVICLILGVFGLNAKLSFYGFETNKPLSLIGLIIIFIAGFKGFAAYGLWFEKDFGVEVAKWDAILGIFVCVVSMVLLPMLNIKGFTIRLELLFLIPYLLKLLKMNTKWKEGVPG